MQRVTVIQGHIAPRPNYWVIKHVDQISFKKVGNLKGKTIVVSGGSRGIGLAIAKRAAKDGANVAILAKTAEVHHKLEGTIYTAAAEIEKLGGKALPIQCDIRFEDQVQNAISQTVAKFGGIDILVNNASAISVTKVLGTQMKRYDLMHDINARGTFLLSKACIPHLLKAENPHILMNSPPLLMQPKWFGIGLAYAIAKYGMSMCVLGLAEEFKGQIAVNALWPKTAIATAAIKFGGGGNEAMRTSRTDEIMADSAYVILTSCHKQKTGNFFIDDEILGPMNLKKFNVDPNVSVEDICSL